MTSNSGFLFLRYFYALVLSISSIFADKSFFIALLFLGDEISKLLAKNYSKQLSK